MTNKNKQVHDKFDQYEQILKKWQKTINLVSASTLAQVKDRHIIDSAQLFEHLPSPEVVLADLGSGAGFPGMVLAMMGVRDVHLIESDTRKAAFLQAVSRETGTPVTVHNARVEDCTIPGVQVVTARALAPLDALLSMMAGLDPHGRAVGLFLKGAQALDEIATAQKHWAFAVETFTSQTDPSGKIVKISDLQPLSSPVSRETP